jgi:hypothetical protein
MQGFDKCSPVAKQALAARENEGKSLHLERLAREQTRMWRRTTGPGNSRGLVGQLDESQGGKA